MKYLVLFIWSIAMLSCDDLKKEVEEIPEGKNMVLIHGFLSPEEEMIKVEVSKTISVFSTVAQNNPIDIKNALVIKDAIVTIKNENQKEVSLAYSDEDRLYKVPATEFLIEPGKKYTLKVLAQGKEFTSVCSIPVPKIEDITANVGVKIIEGITQENLKVKFKDIKGENNFYIVGAKYNLLGNTEFSSSISFNDEKFVTDINGDGLEVFSNGVIVNNDQGLEIKIKVANVDELIYRTLRASFLNRNQAENPFFQPTIPPNNIEGEGGYGVFAGFRLSEKIITVGPN